MHDLAPIAITLGFTTIVGMLMVRLKQPAMLAYMFCGLILGPSGFGIIVDREGVNFLAELGVVMLLYLIGMELSLKAFRNVWRLVLTTALAQIALSILAVYGLAHFLQIDHRSAIVLGFCLAFPSTAVAMKMMENYGISKTPAGDIAIGVLIAQDIAVAPALIAINVIGSGTEITLWEVLRYAFGLIALVFTCYYFLTRSKIHLPLRHLWLHDPDLSPLASIMLCLVAAFLANALGMSVGFGAFFMGLIVANSHQRTVVNHNTRPLQALLLMVFFLSVGLLIDINFLIENWHHILAFWLLVLTFKTLLNTLILLIQGVKLRDCLISSLLISQLGEFSFMITALAFSIGLLDEYLRQMVISVTALSLMTSPICVDVIRRLRHRAAARFNNLRVFSLIYSKEFRLLRRIMGIKRRSPPKPRP